MVKVSILGYWDVGYLGLNLSAFALDMRYRVGATGLVDLGRAVLL